MDSNSKAEILICEKYVSIDSNGDIEFKKGLKFSINQKYISKDDALNIVLELMYNVNNYGLDYTGIEEKVEELVSKVKRYNLTGETFLKQSIFYNDYSKEKIILENYIKNLQQPHQTTQKSITEHENFEYSKKQPKCSLKNIKMNLNHLSKEDLCYILDKNPDLTFEKEKILKNQIADEFVKYNVEVEKLKNSSKEVIKNYLNELIKEYQENEQNDLSSEIRNRMRLDAINRKNSAKIRMEQNKSKMINTVKASMYSGNDQGKPKTQTQIDEPLKVPTKHSDIKSKAVAKENVSKSKHIAKSAKNKRISKHDDAIRQIKEKKALHERTRKSRSDLFSNRNQVKIHENVLHFKSEENNKVPMNHQSVSANDNTKKYLNELLRKIQNFNEKSLQDMVLLKSEYSILYQKANTLLSHNPELTTFNNYFTHFNEIENAINFINQLNKLNVLHKFKKEVNCGEYLSNSKVNEIIVTFEKCFNFATNINKFPIYIKNKIYEQLDDLDYFIEHYQDLKEYLMFDEINEDNPKLNDNKIYKINQNYIENGVIKYRKFFENIVPGKNLDDNQIKAVLTDNDYTQIIAGAGTGKTLTLQGKVKFLIEEKNIPPEDILCISYSVASKEDLKNKIEKTIGKTNIQVRTFHSLGSKILKINEETCRVKSEALNHAIDLYFKNVVFKDQKLMQSIITFFSSYFKNTASQLNSNESHQTIKSMIQSVDETIDYNEMRTQNENKTTIDREYVRSIEELIIANFLYIHDIDYIYEKRYTVKNEFFEQNLENYLDFLFINCEYVPRHIKMEVYHSIDINLKEFKYGFYPDFYLPNDDIYIEHFGVDRNCEAIWLKNEQLRKNYKNSMKYKVKIYIQNNTKLITTYSYYNQENRLTSRLEEKLKEYDVEINDVNYELMFNELILNGKLKEYQLFKRVISTFINLFKGNGLNIDENGKDISKKMFEKFKTKNLNENKGDLQNRNSIFLKLIEEIYEYYHILLNKSEKIDFNDMINNATIALKNGANIHKYQYIIVDEYQDTSHTRYNLLKELQKRTNAKLTVVGDDWQSIYGFTGCDIHLFTNFKEYFKTPSIVKIQNTYRNSQALINIAGKFIKNNPNQIKKELKSTNVTYKKPVKLARYTDSIDEVLMFIYILQEINKKADGEKEVLVLGRNNFDIEEVLCPGLFSTEKLENEIIITPEFKTDLKISFRTIHKSKGLEADYVILLNLNDKLAGFPNKIENDPILDYVTIKKEEINFAEERRLFYVALTRTQNDIFLLAPDKKVSQFVLELEIGGYILDKIEHNLTDERLYKFIQQNIKKGKIRVPTNLLCPKCKIGEIHLIFNTKKGTKFFRCSENCGWNGGWYIGNINDVKYARVCKKCHGMTFIMEKNGRKYRGCNFYSKRHFNSKNNRNSS